MMGISETSGGQPSQARKENSPISGLLRFLVARGGIEPGPRMPDSVSKLLNETLGIKLSLIKRPQLPPPAQ